MSSSNKKSFKEINKINLDISGDGHALKRDPVNTMENIDANSSVLGDHEIVSSKPHQPPSPNSVRVHEFNRKSSNLLD